MFASRFDFSEAVGECGVSGSGNGFGGDVDLDVVNIAVKVETMVVYDGAKRQHVQDEEEWTKYRTLGDALGQRSSVLLLCLTSQGFNESPDKQMYLLVLKTASNSS